MKSLRAKTLSTLTPKSQDISDSLATKEDVVNCYRLFLRRTPDKEGLQYWTQQVQQHGMTVRALTHAFMKSPELRRLVAEDSRHHLVELPRFKINVQLTDFFIGYGILTQKTYEPFVTRFVEQILRPGDTFLDIGANIGYFSLLAASLVGPTGKVIAFEPNPNNCDLLRSSITANQFEQIQLHSYAVADQSQTVWLAVGDSSSNGRILSLSNSPDIQFDGFNVSSVVLDDFLPTLPALHLLKIDIEGAEYLAFVGMTRLLQQHRPTIVMEFSPDLLQITSQVSPEQCLNYLRQLGYKLCILDDTTPDPLVNMPNEAIIGRLLKGHWGHVDLIAFPG